MRKAVESLFRFSWSMSLFGLRQMMRTGTGDPQAGAAFDEVAAAARERLDPSLRPLFDRGDRLQRNLVDLAFGAPPSGAEEEGPAAPLPKPVQPSPAVPAPDPAPAPPPESEEPAVPEHVDCGRLDLSRWVVLGEGLAAGMGDFALSEESQRAAFPAQAARRMRGGLPETGRVVRATRPAPCPCPSCCAAANTIGARCTRPAAIISPPHATGLLRIRGL